MRLTKEHVEQIRRIMVDGDAAFDEKQALFDALDTIAALRLERDALREALKYARRFLEANEVDLSFIDSVLFPASGEPARKP